MDSFEVNKIVGAVLGTGLCMLALNISNLHIELKTVLGSVAADRKLAFRARDDQDLDPRDQGRGKMASQWAVLARTSDAFGSLMTDPRWVAPEIPSDLAVWTDDFNNLLSVLHWHR